MFELTEEQFQTKRKELFERRKQARTIKKGTIKSEVGKLIRGTTFLGRD